MKRFLPHVRSVRLDLADVRKEKDRSRLHRRPAHSQAQATMNRIIELGPGRFRAIKSYYPFVCWRNFRSRRAAETWLEEA